LLDLRVIAPAGVTESRAPCPRLSAARGISAGPYALSSCPLPQLASKR